MLTGNPCLAHDAKDNQNMVTMDASRTSVGVTFRQKQDSGVIKRWRAVADIKNNTKKKNTLLVNSNYWE